MRWGGWGGGHQELPISCVFLGRVVHSRGSLLCRPHRGVDVTVCLDDEQVTQHCRVLDTDAFDIVIGTDFLRRNPQVTPGATSLCSICIVLDRWGECQGIY